MPIKNKYSKKNKTAYSRFDTNPRTKKVQNGGGFFWTSNEEEIARFLAHSAITSILPTKSFTDKTKTKIYIAAQQRLFGYITAMIYRMYKFHKKEVINEHEHQKSDYKPILIKDIFELPVKHNGKYAYGRKLYERTYTSKPQQQTAYTPTTTSIKINEFITELNKNTSQISTHDNIKDRVCQNYSSNTQTIQSTRYIAPLQYKLEQNSNTIYTLFSKCNSNQLESKTIPNIIHKFISSLSIILNGVNDKRTRETASYKQAKVTFEETSSSMKNRLYIEDMATALFYYSMYYTSQKTNPQNYRHGVGYGTGQYAYGGYRGY
jgi:hypothetical protein